MSSGSVYMGEFLVFLYYLILAFLCYLILVVLYYLVLVVLYYLIQVLILVFKAPGPGRQFVTPAFIYMWIIYA